MARGGKREGAGRKPKLPDVYAPHEGAFLETEQLVGQMCEELSRRAGIDRQEAYIARVTRNYSSYMDNNREKILRKIKTPEGLQEHLATVAAMIEADRQESGTGFYQADDGEFLPAPPGLRPIPPANRIRESDYDTMREGIMRRVQAEVKTMFGKRMSMASIDRYWKNYRQLEKMLKDDDGQKSKV